jgi:hypothetical protein
MIAAIDALLPARSALPTWSSSWARCGIGRPGNAEGRQAVTGPRVHRGMAVALSVAVVLSVLVACSSGHANKPETSPATSSASPSFTTDYGQDAALVASHITGCANVAAGSIGAGDTTGMSSTASCTLDGHTVIIDSWKTADATPDFAALMKGQGHLTYASGTGWTAVLADDGATPDQSTLQMQLTNDAGGLFKEGTDGDQYQAASADAQTTIMTQVAAALGGTVGTA